MSRVCFYIDGGNLYNRLKEAQRKLYPTPAKLLRFAQEICTVVPDDAGNVLGGTFVDVLYCNAPISVPSGTVNKLQVFMNDLSRAEGIRLRQGTRKHSPIRCAHNSCAREILECPYCHNLIQTRRIEKGVDLQITAECVADAALGVFDIAVLFTHDEDYSELARILSERLDKELKVAYLKTGRSLPPRKLIEGTRSKQGIRIEKAPSFDAVFPSWAT